jgi:hypothetical protein
MKKETLVKIGLTEEQADKVLKEYEKSSKEDLKGYVAKTEFEEISKQFEQQKATISERDKQLEDLKKSTGDTETLKKQIEELQTANKAQDEKHSAEIKTLKINSAVESALTKAGALNLKSVIPLLDLENADFDKDGKIKGLSEQITKLTTADDSKHLFKSTTAKFKGAKPGEGNGNSYENSEGTNLPKNATVIDKISAKTSQLFNNNND